MRVSFAGTKLHEIVVEKNGYVEREYNNYIKANSQKRNRLLEWLFLIRVKIAYFILNRRTSKTDDEEKNEISGENCWGNGAESKYLERPMPYHFVKWMLQYDVISFDIFDTLIFRAFDSPEYIFDLVGMRMKFFPVYESFTSGRIAAEKKCRELKEKLTGTREITIDDIYTELNNSIGIDKYKGEKTELEVEKTYCYPNPYFEVIRKILITQGKTIVLTSDMYIPKEKLKVILDKCNIKEYEKLYVSCDYGCNKTSGELFRRIMDDYPSKKICHVGDNYGADIEGAKKAGIDAKHYKKCSDLGKNYRPDWMSPLIGSAYKGLINNYIHNGVRTYSTYYEYGFIYGGIYVFGFCNWLEKKCEDIGIDKIIFLARDGDIYQKVYNKYFGKIKNEYIYWSRFTCMKYLSERNRDAFISRVIKHKEKTFYEEKLGDVLEAFNIAINEEKLKKYGLYTSSVISKNNEEAIKKYLEDEWANIVKKFDEERDNVIDEYKKLIGNATKVAVVDVGWTGSGPIGFKTFIENYVVSKCDVFCFMAGASSYYGDGKYITSLMLDGHLHSYLFSPMKNRRSEQIHYTSNTKMTNNAVFEQFTQAMYPSYKGKNGENEVFDIPEVENYNNTSQIHKGILDFCSLYYKTFEKDKYMYNITGWDAYRPFATLTKHTIYFEKNFSDTAFAYGFGGMTSEYRVEPIGERGNSKS